ncbi:MAG: CBS domain-containing protein [Candidatus Sedimenticola endophacoides]
MKVSDWIKFHHAQLVTVAKDEPMARVMATFLSHEGLRDLYVTSPEDRIIGVVRHRRLARLMLAQHLPIQTSHEIMERVSGGVVEDIMERDYVSAKPQEVLDNVLNRMIQYEVEDMPVIDDANRAIGNINLTDVLRAVQRGEL